MREYEHLLAHFNRDVLHRYRAHPELYRLEEDSMGGRVLAGGPGLPLHEVRYALRRLVNGDTCIAVFNLDIKGLPPEERKHWISDLLVDAAFAEDDPDFEAWAARYLGGSWEVPDGPIEQISQEVALLSALTEEALGHPLFRVIDNPLLALPAAENTEALKGAYQQLSCLILDGLEKEVLEALARKLGKSLGDSSKTLNSLKELLPSDMVPSIHEPLRRVRDKRARVHGIQQPAPCPARAEFTQAAIDVAGALQALRRWLEELLGFNSEACMHRQSATGSFPVFSGPPIPIEKLQTLKEAEGKTIKSVEFGEVAPHEDCHESEAIVLEFTDGSALAIKVGSNAQNLTSEHPGIRPRDVRTDLRLSWKPSGRHGSS